MRALGKVSTGDGWDEDPSWKEEGEGGPSWVKVYVNGLKLRHYVAEAAPWTAPKNTGLLAP